MHIAGLPRSERRKRSEQLLSLVGLSKTNESQTL